MTGELCTETEAMSKLIGCGKEQMLRPESESDEQGEHSKYQMSSKRTHDKEHKR
jgi:hypothetical protein